MCGCILHRTRLLILDLFGIMLPFIDPITYSSEAISLLQFPISTSCCSLLLAYHATQSTAHIVHCMPTKPHLSTPQLLICTFHLHKKSNVLLLLCSRFQAGKKRNFATLNSSTAPCRESPAITKTTKVLTKVSMAQHNRHCHSTNPTSQGR